MELSNLFGLPAHPLLVHIPVVLVPLAAIGVIAVALVPKWRARFRWPLVAILFVGFVGTVLAAGSGETLQEKVADTSQVRRHAELGDAARLVVFLFFVAAVAFLVYDWWTTRRAATTTTATDAGTTATSDAGTTAASSSPSSRKGISIGLAALSIVTAVAATGWIVAAGHNGAKATWNEVSNPGGGGGEGGEGARP